MTNEHVALDPGIGDYVSDLVEEPIPVLPELRRHIAESDEEQIHIHPTQGRLLEILVKATGARAILEVGTHLGYSTIWLAHACGPEGTVHTIEGDERRAERASTWVERAGVEDRVKQIVGFAPGVFERLPSVHYDLVFIDGNKESYPACLEESIRCTKTGGLIVADNVLHKGRVVEQPIKRATTRSVDEYNRMAHGHPSLASVIVPLGDGFTISVKIA